MFSLGSDESGLIVDDNGDGVIEIGAKEDTGEEVSDGVKRLEGWVLGKMTDGCDCPIGDKGVFLPEADSISFTFCWELILKDADKSVGGVANEDARAGIGTIDGVAIGWTVGIGTIDGGRAEISLWITGGLFEEGAIYVGSLFVFKKVL